MSDAATPAATPANNGTPSGTPPTPPAATPAATPDNGVPKQPETVTLTKEEVDQLKRDAARAASNQRKADLYDRIVGRSGGSHFKPQTPQIPPSEEEKEAAAREEDRKAERGLVALAADPAFREVLDADPTLRELLVNNPLAVLPMLAPDALDAEDAITLVKEKLAAKAAEIKAKANPPATPPATPLVTPPATPPAGGVNPPSATTPDAEYEEARKNPNTQFAISGMVKAGLKKLGGKH